MAKIKRLVNLLFIVDPINYIVMTTQHEVFGHGYRIRSLNSNKAQVKDYQINLPLPYGFGGGSTSFYLSDKLTMRQSVAISIAGVESTAILANRLNLIWLKSNFINPRQATLYIAAQQDTSSYIFLTTNNDLGHGSNDISSYIKQMNHYFPNDPLTLNQLKKESAVSIFDPFTWFSYYSLYYYIWTGDHMKIPMFKIKDVEFMPSLRYALTPSGPAYYIDQYYVYKDTPIYAYVKFGNHTGRFYYGMGLEHPTLLDKFVKNLGFRVDLFKELKAKNALSFLDYIDAPIEEVADLYGGVETRYGYGFNLIYKPKTVYLRGDLDLQVGYKSVGYIPGESLNASPILRVGYHVKY